MRYCIVCNIHIYETGDRSMKMSTIKIPCRFVGCVALRCILHQAVEEKKSVIIKAQGEEQAAKLVSREGDCFNLKD